jgi:hypothetical protein
MIVKDESHVIEETLKNILKYIPLSYYVISDTGSSDNTVEIIKNFFDKNNIKGEIYNDEWKDFGYNRSLALEHAYNKSDYVFIFDADDRIHGNFSFSNNLDKDSYLFNFGNVCKYHRVLMVNNRLEWKYYGVLHEYIGLKDDKIQIQMFTIEGDYYVDSGKTGSRSNDPLKYKKDAMILEKAHDEAVLNKDKLKIRYSFYCAQSYRDCNEKENAIKWYKKRIEYKDWEQEVYFSYISIGKLYMEVNEPEKAFYYWSLAYDVDDRYECIFEIISYLRQTGKYQLAFQYYKMIKNKKVDIQNKLFVYEPVYDHLLDFELSNICHYNKEYELGLQSLLKICTKKNINIPIKYNILHNFLFYKNQLTLNLDTFYNFFELVKDIYLTTNALFQKEHFIINQIIQKMTDLMMNEQNNILKTKLSDLKNKFSKNKKLGKPKILFSITSCKRFDLFEKTINSFITCCKDIDEIDYFLCVDDNSSKEDRKKMTTTYSFFDFVMKDEKQKGHLSSMNIIWNKLNELKPKYWIHLEDDWLFFKPENYIKKSINFLEKFDSTNIHQILFNKGYAETIDQYDLVGGFKLDSNSQYYLHIKDEEGLNGRNCSYWPHYSFRPSMIKTETILKLGNYNSPNIFFERDYANKYFDNGYKSAFFNEITSIHIGKLTSERNSDKKNAYQLNSIEQFNENNNVNNSNNSNNSNNIEVSNNKNYKIKKINDNYIYLINMDHYGDDFYFKPNLSLDEMIEECEKNEEIICFNNLGYFKDKINLNNLSNFGNDNNGLYVNIIKLKQKYNIDIELPK